MHIPIFPAYMYKVNPKFAFYIHMACICMSTKDVTGIFGVDTTMYFQMNERDVSVSVCADGMIACCRVVLCRTNNRTERFKWYRVTAPKFIKKFVLIVITLREFCNITDKAREISLSRYNITEEDLREKGDDDAMIHTLIEWDLLIKYFFVVKNKNNVEGAFISSIVECESKRESIENDWKYLNKAQDCCSKNGWSVKVRACKREVFNIYSPGGYIFFLVISLRRIDRFYQPKVATWIHILYHHYRVTLVVS